MSGLLRLVQLALAALIASAGGGLVLALLAGLGAAAGAAIAHGGAVADSLSLILVAVLGAGIGIVPAIGSAWLPAFAAGAALWAAGRQRPWARHRLAWAAAGAAVSLLVFWSTTGPGPDDRTLLDWTGLPRAAVLGLFLLAGATAGQIFRSAMAAAAPFLGLDEPEPAEGP